ncbi:hypothetical protein JGU66_21570 [Myxococcaceae bacterium JPH2]|nr:hypothetical protein [Myxococcaceae bacterium JPH2]
MSSPRSRSFIFGLLTCIALLSTSLAHAQPGSPPDGGAPDASTGGPGKDDPGEEDDGTGRVNTKCRSSSDCNMRFTCQAGTCKYTGVRQAETSGCLLGPEAALVLVGLAAVAVPRRRRH